MSIAKKILPNWKNALFALLAAVMLILAFPDFEFWFLAWFALVPLMWAVEREKDSILRSFVVGWIFGTAFFFGTCWWLTYAPIHYAAFPWPLAYFLILIACLGAGVFPGVFAAILSKLLHRFGSWAFLAAPFVWVFTEFLRYWLTGNNWNAIGYSQAFAVTGLPFAQAGGVLAVSFLCVVPSVLVSLLIVARDRFAIQIAIFAPIFVLFVISVSLGYQFSSFCVNCEIPPEQRAGIVIAIQPNVPMSGVDYSKLEYLRRRQFETAESEIRARWERQRVSEIERGEREIGDSSITHRPPTTVILPESPMNFMYNDDREFQQYVRDFTTRNNVSLIFNSAEPDATNGKYFNSAMMIGADGKPVVQYDKIYLLPFGEAVPVPLESVVPAFVGNFSYGREYDLLPFGEAKGGIMICFESHFGQLSRQYVLNGADVIIEMTNDGYLGPTPVLRQHLANAVFRAVETNRPVLRVTNVGITTYIDERGQVHNPLPSYQEGTRVWTVSKSDGSQTFYVRYGDWFAWLCTVVTLGLLVFCRMRRGSEPPAVAGG